MNDEVLKQLRRSLGSPASDEVQAMTTGARSAAQDEHDDALVHETASTAIGSAALAIAEELVGGSAVSSPSARPGDRELETDAVSAVLGPPTVSVRGEKALLAAGPVVLGRGREAFNRTDDGRVSRRHCAVQLGDDGLAYVIDLGSVNGTRIVRGGAQIVVGDQWVQLQAGDVLVTTEGVVLGELVDDGEVGR